ncbi:MAG: class I SAM-dependent methyltransferase [bacterium]|nr:class I SAM-dependent methyltransferase [bacterium]
MAKSKRTPGFAFKVMSLIHDNPLQWVFRNPYKLLKAAGLKPGQKVLEVGCGPGFFTIPAAKIVDEKGVIYALDNHPLSIKRVQEKLKKGGIENVKTILADVTKTGLPDESIDVTFLFGFVHHTGGLENILSELYRVLKPEGILSIEKTPWLSEKKLVTAVERNGFIYLGQQERVFLFTKRKV